jgi:alpha-D-xyloside xylohydrolase
VYDFFSLPLFARPNSLIPVGTNETRPDYDFAVGVTFHLFGLDDGTAVSVSVPTLTGEPHMTLHTHRDGDTVHIQAEGESKLWRVLWRGETAVVSLSGGHAQSDKQGTWLLPEEVDGRLEVKLHSHRMARRGHRPQPRG